MGGGNGGGKYSPHGADRLELGANRSSGLCVGRLMAEGGRNDSGAGWYGALSAERDSPAAAGIR